MAKVVTSGPVTDRIKRRVNTRSKNPSTSGRWWDDGAKNIHDTISAAVGQIETDQSSRAGDFIRFARLYANQRLDSLYQSGLVRSPSSFGFNSDDPAKRLSYNVVQACIDTATAKIAKSKPRTVFVTDGASREHGERAKGLTSFVDGVFHYNDAYSQTQRAFVDACIWGTGVVKVAPDDGAISVERVLPFEIFVDDGEAIYGKPRTMYQRKYVYRDVLLELFGTNEEAKRAIGMAAGSASWFGDSRTSEMVPIIEAWHLPRGKDAGDGRRAVVIDGATLALEPWTLQRFPFSFFTWNNRPTGIWGQGIAEQLIGLQLEINKLLFVVQRAQHLYGNPVTYVEKGSKVNKAHLTNEIGAIVEYAGTPPRREVAQALSGEIYSQLERLYNKAFEITGISMLSATARKPEGINSGAAMREFHDIESERFVVVGQQFERFHCEIAERIVDVAKSLYATDRKLAVKAPGTALIKRIGFKDVDLDEDLYVVRPMAASLLPTTPGARLQKAQELVESGFVDKAWALSMLDIADTETPISLETASLNDIRRCIENMLTSGKYEAPEPYMDLDLAIRLGHQYATRSKLDGTKPENLRKLYRWVNECDRLRKRIKQDSAPPVQPMPPMPEAPPVPVPQA